MPSSADAPRLNALLASLWERNRELMLTRILQLEAAVASTQTGQLATAEREESESNAHKLAGSLGMFGLPRGTEIARALEAMLCGHEPVDAASFAAHVTELREVMFPAKTRGQV